MDRRFRESRNGKLEGWGKPDLKMPSSTIEKLEGGSKTWSFSSPSNISPIDYLAFTDDVNASSQRRKGSRNRNRRRKGRRLDFKGEGDREWETGKREIKRRRRIWGFRLPLGFELPFMGGGVSAVYRFRMDLWLWYIKSYYVSLRKSHRRRFLWKY